jgi:hypothetical protein
VALQISRAAEAVYGVAISPEEIERRWLETGPEGTVAGRAPGLGLRAEDPRLAPRSGPVFPIHTTLVLAPWLLLSAVLLRTYRAGTARWAGQALFWGVVVLFVLFMVGVAAAFVAGLARLWIARWLVEIAAFNLGRSVAGTAAAWAVCALLLGAAYRLAEVQFERMEIPTRPLKYSLLEGLCRES